MPSSLQTFSRQNPQSLTPSLLTHQLVTIYASVEKFAQNCSKGGIAILNKEPTGDRYCTGALGCGYATPPSKGLLETAVTINKDLPHSTGSSS